MAASRMDKINSEVERALQHIIDTELSDPRIQAMISVTKVSVTNDLKHAKVSVSVFDPDEEKKRATFDALQKTAGFLRHCLAGAVQLRSVPELHFELDTSMDNSFRIEQIINKLHGGEDR